MRVWFPESVVGGSGGSKRTTIGGSIRTKQSRLASVQLALRGSAVARVMSLRADMRRGTLLWLEGNKRIYRRAAALSAILTVAALML